MAEEFEAEVYAVVGRTSAGVGFLNDDAGRGQSVHGMQMLFWNPSQSSRAEAYASKCRARGIKAKAVKVKMTWEEA